MAGVFGRGIAAVQHRRIAAGDAAGQRDAVKYGMRATSRAVRGHCVERERCRSRSRRRSRPRPDIDEGQLRCRLFARRSRSLQWTLGCATIIPEIIIAGPIGPPRPRAISTPDAISFHEASGAYVVPGRNPRPCIISAAFSGPGPSNQPRAFWAPCAAMAPPTASRAPSSAISRIMTAQIYPGGG